MMGKVKIPLSFIKKVEDSVTKPIFVRIWLSDISERYELSEELLQLLKDIPYELPSEEDGELLREITRNYFHNRPLVYGIITSNFLPPVKSFGGYDPDKENHIFAIPNGFATEEIPLLYPESVEKLLKEVLELAFIKIAFAKELPKKSVIYHIAPSKEEVEREVKRITKGEKIYVNAYNILASQAYERLTRVVEEKIDYEIWELIGYEVNILREPLEELIKANVSSYMKELKKLIRIMGKKDPYGFLRYLYRGRPIMKYCIHPFIYFEKYGDKEPEKYRRYIEDRFIKDFMNLKLDPTRADISVIYKAIRDTELKKTAEELLFYIYKHVVKDDPERKRLFTEILFKAFRSHGEVRRFLEKSGLEELVSIAEGVIELKKNAAYLKKIHKEIIDLFTEESFPESENPVIEKAYTAYVNLLSEDVLPYLKGQIHASFENLIWFFIDIGDMERAETLTRKALDVGIVSPLFIKITGTLGLKFFEMYAESEDVRLLERSLEWYDDFYELLYLEELSGNLEEEIDIFPRIYENLNNYISAKMFNIISEVVGSEDELDEEWEKMEERIEFIEGLFKKYGTKPYEKDNVMVGDYLLVKVASGKVYPEELFKFYFTSFKLYKVVYLLYSDEREEEAKSILREVLLQTPKDTLEELDIPTFFTNWGLDYEELLADL